MVEVTIKCQMPWLYDSTLGMMVEAAVITFAGFFAFKFFANYDEGTAPAEDADLKDKFWKRLYHFGCVVINNRLRPSAPRPHVPTPRRPRPSGYQRFSSWSRCRLRTRFTRRSPMCRRCPTTTSGISCWRSAWCSPGGCRTGVCKTDGTSRRARTASCTTTSLHMCESRGAEKPRLEPV